MGVVIRQSFWGTAIAYLGVLIGYFNTLYLRPEYLSLDQIGIFTLVTANAMLISPFCSAGMPGTFIKYFPEFGNNKTLKNQFFSFQLYVVIGLCLLVVLIGFMAHDWISRFLESSNYVHYLAITGIIIVVNSVFDLLFSYCRSFLQVIVPSFIRDIFLRIGSIVLVGGFALNIWDFEMAVKGLAVIYIFAVVILFAYLMINYKLRLTFSFSDIDKKWRSKIFNFGIYAMLLGFSFAAINNVSYSQVTSILGDRAQGIFVTCFFIGMIVEMPRRNMLKVISPIFSKAMQEQDMEQVNRMYRKGSITMAIFGVLLFIGIITNLTDLFRFIPQGNGFSQGFWVVVAVCLTKLVVMVFSFGQEIIVFSNYYKYALYLQIGAAILLVTLNNWLLPIWGITGAGISYFITITLHTFIKFLFVYQKFDVSPFEKSHLALLFVSILVFTLFWMLPFPFSPVPNILIRSVLTTVVFTIAIFKMNISPDINGLIRLSLEKVLKIKI